MSQPSWPGRAKPASLVIVPGQIVTPVSPTLYGMMTEEINHSYDGGHPAPFALHDIEIGNENFSINRAAMTRVFSSLPRALRGSYPQAS